MGGIVLNGATSGSTTVQATDAVTATITLPSTTGTVQLSGTAGSFTDLTTTGNTILGNASTDTLNVGNGDLVKNASGTVTMANDASISGLTVGKGGGSLSANTAVGASALTSTTTGGNWNTAVGYQSAYTNTTGTNNTAIGRISLYLNSTGSANTSIGSQALYNNTASDNTAVGTEAMYANTSGTANTALGRYALNANTTASNNTAVGYQAGYSCNNTTPLGENTILGYTAGYGVTTGYRNTILGSQAGYSASTAHSCTFIGRKAGYNTTGKSNTFLGSRSDSTDGSAGTEVTTGYNHTIVGNYNGNQGGLDIRTASNYIVLSDGDGNPRLYNDGASFYMKGTGSYPQCSITNDSTTGGGLFVVRQNNVYCGAVAVRGSILGSTANDLALFAESSRGVYTYTNGGTAGPYVASGGTSWTNSSDERLKNITGEIQDGLTKVCSLRAAEFTWKSDESSKPQVGLIAQDVQTVLPEAVSQSVINKDDDTEYLGVSYTEVIPLLVAAIKELKAEIDQLKGN